ncbi:hypothetical protein [Nibribacter koreensis]|uniref:Uncharacterized protein n=1 Tax=Nibribacter koreensis TaxID=1084519 RepID=A0ABP8F5T7_9BACT
MEKRQDPLTGEEFIPARRNQRFASRENQVRYNNLVAQGKRDAKREVDRVLDMNRTILLRLLGEAKSATHSQEYLAGAGFDFSAFTQVFKVDGGQRISVYDMALKPLGDGRFTITRC